jgi:hypothetical protein
MKLKKFKKIIDKAVKDAGDTNPDILFYVKEKEYKIKRIGQFSIIPDVTVSLKKIK